MRETKQVKFVKQCFSELIYFFVADLFNSFLASCQLCLQVSNFFNEMITRWATISFKKSIDIEYKTNVTVVT